MKLVMIVHGCTQQLLELEPNVKAFTYTLAQTAPKESPTTAEVIMMYDPRHWEPDTLTNLDCFFQDERLL